jgi:hypothetical protein
VGGYEAGRARVPQNTTAAPVSRSPVAGAAAVVLLLVGLLMASYSVLVPALLGLAMLSTALTFVSARVNPFAMGFYLPTKPSWTAIAVVALVGVVLVSAAWTDWRSGLDPLLPHALP